MTSPTAASLDLLSFFGVCPWLRRRCQRLFSLVNRDPQAMTEDKHSDISRSVSLDLGPGTQLWNRSQLVLGPGLEILESVQLGPGQVLKFLDLVQLGPGLDLQKLTGYPTCSTLIRTDIHF